MQSSLLLDAASALIDHARRCGADAADATGHTSSAHGVSVRLGVLEDIDRSESAQVGLRAFVGQRSASVSTSDLSPAGLKELAERVVAMARHAPEDPFAALAPEAALARGPFPDLAITDASELSAEELRDRARAAEDAARAVSGVRNSEGGSASVGRGGSVLVTSTGFAAAFEGTSHALSASVIAGEGDGMQRDYAARSARHLADLPDPAEVGRLAGERAVARLAPATPSSGAMPVVFDPRVSASLVGHLLGAMAAPSIARRASFLVSREKETLFPDAIRIVEDPLRPRGLRSRPFDGEGIACTPRALVESGRVTGWLTNVASAAQLGLPLTGHASRGGGGTPGVSPSNVDLLAGGETVEELIADIADGVLVDYLIGQGINPVTGDYSRGAAGRRIVNGRIEGPVAGFTIAGNLIDMFASMRAANDLETYRAINAPTLRIDGMTVAAA
ncbi:TldD/PmbA family protein [Parafrankia sp. BMG5.11]|uniref:TldD/PmbA family protein n=1 Tax=Parafrankia sp. BMG5.11 TaxID=222540 RepID=UPI00103F225E|nr:TldD/PmbA family protein [Parafrankia sp. BMG5.11]TCJ41368.1 TldD/PmbA family protein [Parafrankia sp. BMG5.11]